MMGGEESDSVRCACCKVRRKKETHGVVVRSVLSSVDLSADDAAELNAVRWRERDQLTTSVRNAGT